MKIETALNHQKRAIQAIRDLYSTAKICGMDSNSISNEYQKIVQAVSHCPSWVRTYCDGYRTCMNDFLYSDCLVYGGYIDGVFHTTDKTRADYYQKQGMTPFDFSRLNLENSGHYWTTTKEPKPYFVKA